MKVILALLAVSAIAGVCSADMFHSPNVVELTASNFAEKTADGKAYFIKFYAPWCGHCKKLAPAWGELGEATKSDPNVEIAHIDCTNARDVCQEAGIKGYPTLKVFNNGSEFKAYKGGRDLESLKTFITEVGKEVSAETTA